MNPLRAARQTVAILALLVGVSVVATIQPAAAQAGCTERVLVVAGANPAPVSDTSLVGTLEARNPDTSGCVVVADDDTISATTATTFDAVVIASSVAPAALRDRLVDAAVPILVAESFLFDDMAMVADKRAGELASRQAIYIADPSHPLSAGLAGLVEVYESPSIINFGGGDTTSGLEAVANVSVASSQSTLFGFAPGSQLVDRMAVAARVGFFSADNAVLSADGKALLNASIDWLLTAGGDPEQRAVAPGDGDNQYSPARSSRRALLVVGATTPVLVGDQPVVTRLVHAGFEVELVDDDADLSNLDLTDVDFVAISTSVAVSKIGTRFNEVAVPIITWEAHLFDDLGMASRSGETSRLRTLLTVADPTSPLAGSLGGANRAVYQSPNRFAYAVVGDDAEVIAHEVNRPDRAVVFAYEPGDELVDGSSAAAARVGLFASYAGSQVMTAQGLDLFDAAWSTLTGVSVSLVSERDMGTPLRAPVALDTEANPVAVFPSIDGPLVVHCDDAACRGGDLSTSLNDGASAPAMTLDKSGHPVIFYRGAGAFRLVHCNDPSCAGADESDESIDDESIFITSTSVALGADGNPVLAYATDSGLKLVICNDPNCSGGDDAPVVFDADNRGTGVAVRLDADNHPVLTYSVGPPGAIRVVRCNDPACVGGDESIGAIAGVISANGLVLDALGNPVVVAVVDSVLGITHCNDPLCGGDDDIAIPLAEHAERTQLALALDGDGHPVVAFRADEAGLERLEVIRCNDPDCIGSDEYRAVIDRSSPFLSTGLGPVIASDSAGNVAITYGVSPAFIGVEPNRLKINQGHKLARLD